MSHENRIPQSGWLHLIDIDWNFGWVGSYQSITWRKIDDNQISDRQTFAETMVHTLHKPQLGISEIDLTGAEPSDLTPLFDEVHQMKLQRFRWLGLSRQTFVSVFAYLTWPPLEPIFPALWDSSAPPTLALRSSTKITSPGRRSGESKRKDKKVKQNPSGEGPHDVENFYWSQELQFVQGHIRKEDSHPKFSGNTLSFVSYYLFFHLS